MKHVLCLCVICVVCLLLIQCSTEHVLQNGQVDDRRFWVVREIATLEADTCMCVYIGRPQWYDISRDKLLEARCADSVYVEVIDPTNLRAFIYPGEGCVDSEDTVDIVLKDTPETITWPENESPIS